MNGLHELIEANNAMIKLASYYNEICYYCWRACSKNGINDENRAEKVQRKTYRNENEHFTFHRDDTVKKLDAQSKNIQFHRNDHVIENPVFFEWDAHS